MPEISNPVRLIADSQPDEERKLENIPTDELTQLYRSLADEVVELIRTSQIRKDIVEGLAGNIVGSFQANLYSDLLLRTYSYSQENYLISHIVNITILSIGFSIFLGLSTEDATGVGIAALCHDVGMTDYTHIFQQDREIESPERSLCQSHPMRSVQIFQNIFSKEILNAMMDVHECVNGEGYPNGKSAEEISYWAKIISICDVFESLTHPRSFRVEFNPYEAIKIIIKKRDLVFDRSLIKQFVNYASIFPVGTFVALNTGETAMVTAANRGFPTRPFVKKLLTVQNEVQPQQPIIDLLKNDLVHILGPVNRATEKELIQILNPRGMVLL